MKNGTKRSLIMSLLSMVLCMSMLIGTTFAWFTDSASSTGNKIQAGRLDVQLLLHDGNDYIDISESEAPIFGANAVVAQNSRDTIWEPGKTQVAYLAIKNSGNLDLKYQVTLNVVNPEDGKNLYQAMQYVITPDAQNGSVKEWNGANAQSALLGSQVVSNGEGTLKKDDIHYFALSVHMMEEAGNEYQEGKIDFDLTVFATQLDSEEDSFTTETEPGYDAEAEYPVWLGETDTEWDGEGTQASPYQISSVEELAGLAAKVNGTTQTRASGETYNGKYFELTSDIDLESMNWAPIGTSGTPFQGNFNGNGHTISNLVCAKAGVSNMGLFGFTQNGKIENLTVDNAIVEGRLNIGVVAGTPYTTSYSNIKVTGDVKVKGMAYVGGAFGKNAYANMTNIEINANEGSYVKANSVENGTAYRTYVGGVIGFAGEGGHTFKDIKSNIDVTGSTLDVGGIIGIAHYGNNFINCSSSGDVTIEAESLEIGGIAGVWNNTTGYTVTFENCEYTGKLSAPGVSTFPNNGLVGKAYSETGKGILNLNGKSSASFGGEEYVAANDATTLSTTLNDGGKVVLADSLTFSAKDTTANSGYGATGVSVKGGTLDGNGETITVNDANDTWDTVIHTTGGTIKNLKAAGAMRGIFMGSATGNVYIDNVSFDTIYTFNSDGGSKEYGVYISNSTMNGWTSYSNVHKEVVFTNCEFTEGNGYAFLRAYNSTEFKNCRFDAIVGFEVQVVEGAVATFENCYYGDTLITADNITTLGLLNSTDASLVTVK